MPQPVQMTITNPGDPLAAKAVALFRQRWRERTTVPLRQRAATPAWTLVIGTTADSVLCATVTAAGLAIPAQPQAYALVTTGRTLTLCGTDGHGVLYGLGHLLRHLAFADDTVPLPAVHMLRTPAVYGRGVYCATHFNNYYESAPMARIERYIEELALWGVDLLTVWLDLNWFPYGFWEDPDSRGMRMVTRLRRMGEVARTCSMTVGACGLGNEGFANQPPPELRADMAARHGGFYPDSQICPSQPAGLRMILDNRRIVLELLGPLDLYVHWPYDQGGCGCDQCTHAPGRWGKTFLALGPKIADLVRQANPDARVIVSTWLMDDAERAMVYDRCDAGADWFQGIMTQAEHADEHPLDPRYTRLVFPEISMFDCYFTSYGCNGANPAPARCAADARALAAADCGTTLYSEGIYEDVNKVIYAGTLWDPARDTEEILTEYGRYYFGSDNAVEVAECLRALETTWGPTKLKAAAPATVTALAARLATLGTRLPRHRDALERWHALADRAEMDRLMQEIGPEEALITESRTLFEHAAYLPAVELRARLAHFLDALHTRRDGINRLFAAHWRYLRFFHMEKTNLVFLPDAVVGKYHWETLIAPLAAAARRDDATLRSAISRAFRRWYWCNGIDVDYLFF